MPVEQLLQAQQLGTVLFACQRLPNVTGVGIGERAGKMVIKVFVTHKTPESALQPQEIVPKMLEGYITDVEEIGVIAAQT